MNRHKLFSADLKEAFAHNESLWHEFQDARLFITGGTGIIGSLLLETLQWANARYSLGAQAVILTRDPEGYARKNPGLANSATVQLHTGDIRNFPFPEGRFTHVIHAATPVVQSCDALDLADIIVAGTRRALEFARMKGARRFLLTSSGAVYGRPPANVAHLREDDAFGPDPTVPRSVYGESKRYAEMLCALYASTHGIQASIARCFAIVGPYLPLDAHFAIGNFIRDALVGGPLKLSGDGTPFRSYLYGSDLSAWLWTLLVKAPGGRAYNVGSEEAYSILDVARVTARTLAPKAHIEIASEPVAGAAPEHYIPSTERAQTELGLRQTVGLVESIRRTARWYSAEGEGRYERRAKRRLNRHASL